MRWVECCKTGQRSGLTRQCRTVVKTARTALAKFHQDMEAINRLAKPSYLSVIEQMERTLEPIRRQQLEISRALEMSGAAARIREIANANQHWQELVKQTTVTSRIAESLAASHRSWLEHIKPVQHDFSHLSQLQTSARLALCDTSLRLAATERLMAGIDFEAIRSCFQIEMPVIAGLESSIVKWLDDCGHTNSSHFKGKMRRVCCDEYQVESESDYRGI
ncbi:hypothetical protein [Nitrosococcus watsonii]|nr:hypothetical protein [Nitrosococcus watsonii]